MAGPDKTDRHKVAGATSKDTKTGKPVPTGFTEADRRALLKAINAQSTLTAATQALSSAQGALKANAGVSSIQLSEQPAARIQAEWPINEAAEAAKADIQKILALLPAPVVGGLSMRSLLEKASLSPTKADLSKTSRASAPTAKPKKIKLSRSEFETIVAGMEYVTPATAEKLLAVSDRQIRSLVSNEKLRAQGEGHYKKISVASIRRRAGYLTNSEVNGTERK
jgi:hypothetical protein